MLLVWKTLVHVAAPASRLYSESQSSALTLQHRVGWLATHCTCKEARLKVYVLKITPRKKTGKREKKKSDESGRQRSENNHKERVKHGFRPQNFT